MITLSPYQKIAGLALRGDRSAALLLEMIKSSAVGRGEGFGNTNGMVNARSGLMSPHNLTGGANRQPTLPMAGTMPLGQLGMPAPSTIGQPVGMPKPMTGPNQSVMPTQKPIM